MKTRRAEGGTAEADAHPAPRWLASVPVREWMRPDPVVVRRIYEEADAAGITTSEAAERLAAERLAQA